MSKFSNSKIKWPISGEKLENGGRLGPLRQNLPPPPNGPLDPSVPPPLHPPSSMMLGCWRQTPPEAVYPGQAPSRHRLCLRQSALGTADCRHSLTWTWPWPLVFCPARLNVRGPCRDRWTRVGCRSAVCGAVVTGDW